MVTLGQAHALLAVGVAAGLSADLGVIESRAWRHAAGAGGVSIRPHDPLTCEIMWQCRIATAPLSGWSVEVVELTGTPDHGDDQRLSVRFHGFHVADVRSVAELERWFPLTDLEPELSPPASVKAAESGSCGGSNTSNPHPGARQAITRCPGPFFCASRAGPHRHGIHETITRPGPHS